MGVASPIGSHVDDSSLMLGGGHHHDTFLREYSRPGVVIRRRVAESDQDETLALPIVFGVVSVPWTYAFVAVLEIPVWPLFVASTSF